MKKKYIIVIILLICFIYLISKTTYASLQSIISPKVDVDLADWNINVNELLISGENGVKSIDLVNNLTTVNHVKPNKAAPGAVSKYTIKLDTSNTEVSAKVVFNINDKLIDNNKAFTFTGFSGDLDFIRTGVREYTCIIKLANINNTKTIHLNFEWIDEEIDITNGDNLSTDIGIDLGVYQYKGEEIVKYNG